MGSRYTTEERIAQHEARLSDLRAKAAKERRRDDARRKVVVGATILSRAREDERHVQHLVRTLDTHCSRPADRAFLALPAQRPGEAGRAESDLDVREVVRRLTEVIAPSPEGGACPARGRT